MKHSYAEVVRKTPQGHWKGPIIETTSNAPTWLSYSVVGWMCSGFTFDSICEEFIKGGMSRIKLRYMGNNLVLFTPKNGERMEEVIMLNKEWFVSIFEDIEPWSDTYEAGHKIVWTRCHGLPVSFWNKDCFSKVVGEVASLVDIDESTLSWENLEYARLQVRLLKSCKAEMSNGFKINGHVYNISLVEELPSQGRGECLCPEYHFTSSDSISSSETLVEETFVSGMSCDDEDDNDNSVKRRNGVSEEAKQNQALAETKWKFFKQKAQSDMGCQNKVGFTTPYGVKRCIGGV